MIENKSIGIKRAQNALVHGLPSGVERSRFRTAIRNRKSDNSSTKVFNLLSVSFEDSSRQCEEWINESKIDYDCVTLFFVYIKAQAVKSLF